MKKRVIIVIGVLILGIIIFSGFRVNQDKKRLVDNIEYDFINDESVLGIWTSIDFVKTMEDYNPNEKAFKGDLHLENMKFLENGELKVDDDSARPWFFWTKGIVTHSGNQTASRYIIKEINGIDHLFFEWKSGDYVYKHKDPMFYVLVRE